MQVAEKKISNDFLKNIIIGFFYPAILGNIIYVILSYFNNPEEYTNYIHLNLKLWLLFVITIFYLCDFLYIYFTKDFKKMMFLAALVFIVLLFTSFSKIHIGKSITDISNAPDIKSILNCFIGFFVIYLIWDIYEKFKIKDDKNESRMYKIIIYWEILSIIIIILNLLFVDNINESYFPIFTLVAITVSFGILDFCKYRFWKAAKLKETHG